MNIPRPRIFLAMPKEKMDAAESNGYTSREVVEALEKANKQMDKYDARLHCTLFYKLQSLQKLGEEKNRVHVPIYIEKRDSSKTVDSSWYSHLHNAIAAINLAAPGLYLQEVDHLQGAKVQIYGTSKETAFTRYNILTSSVAEIYLYHKWSGKKRTSVHELLHALGFAHEQKRGDGSREVAIDTEKNNDRQYTPETSVLGITRFDPFSIMLYSEKHLVRKPEGDTVWKLKPQSEKLNEEMSEVDKVGLNLMYRPCKSQHYNPHLSDVTGMWYCGREVMDRHNHPAARIVYRCGPSESANCHACRVLRNNKVLKLNDGNKWQGWSGLFYCGKYFGKVASGHDGYCGPNNGPPCPECKKILLP